MRSFVVLCVLCLHLGLCYGEPAGVGVYAYQDSPGNRYGGTYELDDAQLFGKGKNGAGGVNRFGDSGANPPYRGWNNFIPNFGQSFQFDDFFPEYFSNLENLLQEAFNKNFENQKLAYNAARKAFDLTSNQAGYIPNSPGRFDNFGGFGAFMPMMGQNSAFAGGAVGPGFQHQIAAISPENPAMQNVNVMNRFADTSNANPRDGFYSVSSSSYATSSDLNGKKAESRGAETVVNNNGQVTRYKVHN